MFWSVGEGEGSEGTGVEALDAFLDGKRGRFQPFEVEKEIARGGMGAVILARDKAIQRELAVKVMRPQIADSEEHRLRFLEEAQVTGQLEHPNIVPIHELGKDAEGNLYFTMKLVKGRSLGQIIAEMKDVEGASRQGAKTPSEGGGRRGKGSSRERRPHRSLALQSREGRSLALQSRESPEGEEKNSALESQATVSLSDLLNIFLKVCDGIAFAHSRGVVHRDLKPDNIMVGEFGEVQIMDWGLAKVLRTDLSPQTLDLRPEEEQTEGEEGGSDQSSVTSGEVPDSSDLKPETRNLKPSQPKTDSAIRRADTVRSVRSDSDVALTVDGQITGTPAYMPPEQAEGKLESIDHRSDVYSLGAILYEILTLERPIQGKTQYEVLLRVSDGKITPPEQRTPERHIPKELSAVVMKAMAKNRRKRYQSVQDLGQDIKLFLEGRSVSAREDSFAESVLKLVKRNKGVSVALGGALLVISSLGALSYVRVTKERDLAVASKQRAVESEGEAVKARNRMHANALETSRQLALQAVRAAEQSRWAEAELRVEAAVQISPADGPWGAYAQGMLHKERKEFEKAEESFKKALASDARHQPSIAALAEVQSSLGKLKDAVALIKTIDGTADWRTLMAAGEALYECEDYRHAQEAYEQAQKQMESAKDVPPEMRQRLEEKLGQARAWVKCEGFWELIRDLQPAEQADRVGSKLRELHGGGVGISYPVKEDVLAEMKVGGEVAYLQPLKGLSLRKLEVGGHAVRDLSPLRGMPLRELLVSRPKFLTGNHRNLWYCRWIGSKWRGTYCLQDLLT